MSGMLTDDEAAARASGTPPTLDLVRHFRDLRSALIPALLIASVCAGGVFYVRSQAPARWQAVVTARADTTPPPAQTSDSTAANLLTASYIALGADPAVLQSVVTTAGAPWNTNEAQSRIALKTGQTPGLLQVTVLGDSAPQAAAVARQVVLTLDSAARTRASEAAAAQIQQLQATVTALNNQLMPLLLIDPKRAGLQAQYQSGLDQITQLSGSPSRLTALAAPTTSAGPVSPLPRRDAALTLLAVLVVAAELMVALRGRWGRAVSASWASRTARKHGAVFVDCASSRHAADLVVVEMVVLRKLGEGADVLVLYCPPVDPTLLAAVAKPAAPRSDLNRIAGSLVQLSAVEAWWRSEALSSARLGVVVAERGSKARDCVLHCVLALADAGIPARLLLVKRGQLPLDRAQATKTVPSTVSATGPAHRIDVDSAKRPFGGE